MLYVTTRNDQDAFTLQYATMQSRGVDGGLYCPLHFPSVSAEDLKKLREASFNQRIASVLNMFFSTKLSGWDVDFSVGRYPVRLADLSHRIVLGEFWHNLQWRYDYLEAKLLELVSCENLGSGNWPAIAIRMAILASAILERDESKEDRMDIAAPYGDFSLLISAWYLRKMGFPVGNIICCCAEDNQLWELSCLGQMKTDGNIPVNLERLVYDCGGVKESFRYVSACIDRAVYTASETMLNVCRNGLYVSVISDVRLEKTIPNVFRTYDYLLSSEAALAYCGLMDYRTKTGVTRPVLIACDYSPVHEAEKIAAWMNLSTEALLRII